MKLKEFKKKTNDKSWISLKDKTPRPYQEVEMKGQFVCEKVLYMDSDNNGWEYKNKVTVCATHWKEKDE